ncbi:hypothetical protein [Massilia phyllosphaerae]|jgi:hypothetical protein|uniref:hypothetical protein n=1 Tax=Massilia phyllosphaerae TaxID=3106034 RepID=UPI002B1CDC69|nr:hypothetical protein [Massilia sp. SGZ-792]
MMSKLLANRRGRLALAALPVLLVLAACGHHHDDDNTGGGGTTPPGATSDAFVTYVSQQVATQSETAEPLSTDGVNPTVPENTEPVALPAS